MNSIEFEHFKLYADSTLKQMKKDELIDYIHMLHHNWSVADERAESIKEYAEKLQDKETPKKVKYIIKESIDRYLPVFEHLYFCPSCGRRLRKRQHDNYCGRCGQSLNWEE